MKYGLALSSEEFGPKKLVELGAMAEARGFEFVMVSDHYHPWIDKQGESPFVWNVIGALSQATKKIQVGTGVTAPIIRIHPAIVAQAAATSQVQLEGRFMLGVGTGENLNEHVVGSSWPTIDIRREMLTEAIEIMRLLWGRDGHYKTYYGSYYTVEDAKIYTIPLVDIPIIYAASGEHSARIAGHLADGFVTTSPRKKLVDAFRETKKRRKRPIYGQMSLVFDKSKEVATTKLLRLWPLAGLPAPLNTELRLPSYFESTAEIIDKKDLSAKYFLGNSKEEFEVFMGKYQDAGFSHLYFHNIGDTNEEFIDWFSKNYLGT